MPVLAVNRRAEFDYDILETYEAGIALHGFEVKSVKAGRMSLTGAFAVIKGEEVWLLGAAIPPYQPKNTPPDYEPTRTRRLLLHRAEIKKLTGTAAQRGLTLIPLKVYTRGSRIKLAIGLARHRKKYDKRERIREREAAREIARQLKHRG